MDFLSDIDVVAAVSKDPCSRRVRLLTIVDYELASADEREPSPRERLLETAGHFWLLFLAPAAHASTDDFRAIEAHAEEIVREGAAFLTHDPAVSSVGATPHSEASGLLRDAAHGVFLVRKDLLTPSDLRRKSVTDLALEVVARIGRCARVPVPGREAEAPLAVGGPADALGAGAHAAVRLARFANIRRPAAPTLGAHLFTTVVIGVLGATAGCPVLLLAPVIFLAATFAARKAMSMRATSSDEVPFSVRKTLETDLPFQAGKAATALLCGAPASIVSRLDLDDSVMSRRFGEVTANLWCDHGAFLVTVFVLAFSIWS